MNFRYVMDASVVVEYLLRTPLGLRIEQSIADASLYAPQLLDVEVLSVMRRLVLFKKITKQRALLALEDLHDCPIERIEHRKLWNTAWTLRNNVSAYDAFYVATAKFVEAILLTADGPLSKATSLGITVQNMRFSE